MCTPTQFIWRFAPSWSPASSFDQRLASFRYPRAPLWHFSHSPCSRTPRAVRPWQLGRCVGAGAQRHVLDCKYSSTPTEFRAKHVVSSGVHWVVDVRNPRKWCVLQAVKPSCVQSLDMLSVALIRSRHTAEELPPRSNEMRSSKACRDLNACVPKHRFAVCYLACFNPSCPLRALRSLPPRSCFSNWLGSGSRFNWPHRLTIFHLILGWRSKSSLRNLVSWIRGWKSWKLQWEQFSPTRFSLVRIPFGTWLHTEVLTKKFSGAGGGAPKTITSHILQSTGYEQRFCCKPLLDQTMFFTCSMLNKKQNLKTVKNKNKEKEFENKTKQETQKT